MLGKAPKRPIETLYLKEGEKEKLVSMIDDFFNPKTRELYLSFGMPYKHIVMLYGIPGSGKTSTITALASYFDCEIYTIPITKELTDYGLIEAFSYVNDKEDKKRIIVLEDIDCIFDNTRKEGDEHNMVTLQAILNCLDGHMCVEGTLLFMTANNPEKMDYALLRSCRIDYKLELGYADEYQTKNIYETFLSNQRDNFNKFYKKIKHKEFTTAMLQEFLFYNRNCDDILEYIPKFIEIIEKNKPAELSSDKKEQNLYM
jgi:chaperone BCS1